jgi:hypothetical protein
LDVKKSQEKLSKEWTNSKKEVEIRSDVFQADISNCTQGLTVNNHSELEDQLEANNRKRVNCYIMKSVFHINICPFFIKYFLFIFRKIEYLFMPLQFRRR